ncbi:hypothetical protein [Prevotella sp.]|nr:hypothetical protein [Prevotella sp.]
MTKHLRFLFVMLLAMIWSAGWAQKVTLDFSNSSNPWNLPKSYSNVDKSYSYNGYTISFKNGTATKGYMFTSYKKQFFLQMGEAGMTLVLPTFDFEVSKIEVVGHSTGNAKTTQNIFVDNTAICKETTGCKGINSYIIPNTCQAKGTVYKLKVTNNNITRITSIKIYEKETTSSKTPTKVTFPIEYSNKTFTFTEGKLEGFTAPTATEANNIEGSIKYSSTNESVVSVNASTGELSFLGYGEATITATFTPTDVEKYKESSDSYMVVNNNHNVKNVTFIDTIDKGNNASQNNSDEITKDGVTIFGTNAAFGNSNGNYRFYKGTKINISVTTGTITKIEFKNGSALNYLKGEGYTATDKAGTWIGNARTVVLTNSSSVAKAKSITVYVSLPSEITLNETADNTIEAKTGVNVTLNRPMNVGRWNTFCVPFSIDANQVTSQFGEGTQIAEYSVSKSKDDVIDFATVQSNAIVAGKAYLVKPTKVAATEGYTFSNVNITALVPTKETVDNGAIDFRGIYNPTDITVGLPTNTFAAGIVSNVVKKAVSDSNMKGFRAFFIIPEGAGAQSSYMLKIDGTATSINSINGADVVVNAPVYNLQGQRVDGNNLTPGIYVKAGKKFVVK